MAGEREDRLLKLAAEMEELGLREEPHDIRNLLGQVEALRACSRSFEDENRRLREQISGMFGPTKRDTRVSDRPGGLRE